MLFLAGVSINKMPKVLISGIGGFVAAHILEHLLTKTGWHIIGIASWKHKGQPERVSEVLRGNPLWKDRLTIITHDLVSPLSEKTKKQIGYVDYILNIASESHVDRSITDPVPFIKNNVDLTLNMLEYAREYPPKVFLQFSTDETSGPAPQGVYHDEWAPIIPSNPYSASKAAQEAICISYWRTYGVPIVITNGENFFGEMQDPEKYIAKIVRKVSRGETITVHGKKGDVGSRFYLHARNAADALLFILGNLPPKKYEDGTVDRPDKYNIVSDSEIDNLSLAKIMAEIMGKPLKYEFLDFHAARSGHDRRYALSGDKLRSLGWKAPIGFDASLKKYIDWTLMPEHRIWL